jgi:putative sterol carrier protein
MAEVKVREGEELNGLGVIVKSAIDQNLQNPKKFDGIKGLDATIVIKDTVSGAAITIHFGKGEISMHNDAIDKPTAKMEGTWENLGKVLLSEIGPIWAALTLRIKSRGNILKLMKASKIIIMEKQKGT